MPLLNRVDFTASTSKAQEQIYNCLELFASHQLRFPNPGVLVYHFTRPDPVERPLYMEYFEVYQDDAIFWSHIDQKLGNAFIQSFTAENMKTRGWYLYGDFEDEQKMKTVCQGMGASFPEGKLAGFYINADISTESLENTKGFMFLKFLCEIKKGQSYSGLKNPRANTSAATEVFKEMAAQRNAEILTFFAHIPEPQTFPNKVEVLLVLTNKGLNEFLIKCKETWSKIKELSVKITCDVYGDISPENMSELSMTSTARQCKTELGYIVHPQAKDVLK